jgi:hypothetical protein
MNAINLQPIKNNEKENGYNTAIKNSLGYFLLNKLLDLRYHAKKKSFFIQTIIFFEAALIKMHLIPNHNGYNTSIKNKLLDLRYHVKKKSFFIKTIIFFETILIKMHLIANYNQ